MRSFVIFAVVLALSRFSSAEAIVPAVLDSPELVGSGAHRMMLMKIYEAELYSNDGEFDISRPFALKLIYARKLNGDAIADKSIELIRRQGIENEVQLAAWHELLNDIFPDVEKGTEIVGAHEAGVGAHFYVDGELVGLIEDPALCEKFFGIWFAEDTSAPRLRTNLLGLAAN